MYKSLRSMLLMVTCAVCGSVLAQDNLKAMQQKFVNEKFGMFIHFNMPSFVDEDWPDPDMPAETFHPKKLDCNQWAEAALSAGMKFGCLTTVVIAFGTRRPRNTMS